MFRYLMWAMMIVLAVAATAAALPATASFVQVGDAAGSGMRENPLLPAAAAATATPADGSPHDLNERVFGGWNLIERVSTARVDAPERIEITGRADMPHTPIVLSAKMPDGGTVQLGEVQPRPDGTFSADVDLREDHWDRDGFYVIKLVQRGMDYEDCIHFKMAGGVFVPYHSSVAATEDELIALRWVMADTVTVTHADDADNVEISGRTDMPQVPITLGAATPDGGTVQLGEVQPRPDGTFSIDVDLRGDLWDRDGLHTMVLRQQGSPPHEDHIVLDVVDRMVVPEFGTVAALVMAAAVMSVLAISARSGTRLWNPL